MKKFILAIIVLVLISLGVAEDVSSDHQLRATATVARPKAAKFTLLHEFQDGPKDGASPAGALVRDQAGNLYGTTFFGDPNQKGVVYKIDPSGAESVVYAFPFDDTHGRNPIWGVILDQAGNLYGTADGGPNDEGVIFKISPSGEETVLFDFPSKLPLGPIHPNSGLLMDKLGNLYGATVLGGNGNCIDGCGTIYRLDTAGKAHMLHQFTGGTDGFSPIGSLIADANGNLYGVAQVGGDFNCSTGQFLGEGCGTVFKIASNGKFTVLHTFHGGRDSDLPQGGLLLNPSDGKLYGATTGDGNVRGVLFQVSTTGQYKVVHRFTGTDGLSPNGVLISDDAGHIYGTAGGGGSDGLGTAFVMNPAGQLKVLHNFTGGRDGDGPMPGLTRDPAGNLFGTAFKNLRTKHNVGDVFEITP